MTNSNSQSNSTITAQLDLDLIVPGKRKRKQVERLKVEESTVIPKKPKAHSKSKPKSSPKATTSKSNSSKKPTKPTKLPQCLRGPFYSEAGFEWNGLDIDINQLAKLRAMWEFPSACHIIWMLQSPLRLKFQASIKEYEQAFLLPESSLLMEELMTKLLLDKSDRDRLNIGVGLPYQWWNQKLKETYENLYQKWYHLRKKAGLSVPQAEQNKQGLEDAGTDEDSVESVSEAGDMDLADDEWKELEVCRQRLEPLGDVNPLQEKSFLELTIEERTRIVLNLCEAVAQKPSNEKHLRSLEEEDLRVEPFAVDRCGNAYYYFAHFYEDRRVYRLTPAASNASVDTGKWEIFARGLESFRKLLEAVKSISKRVRGETDLKETIEVFIEDMEKEAVQKSKEEERLQRKAILDALPRKRSARLKVKNLELFEQEMDEAELRAREIQKQQEEARALIAKKKEDTIRRLEREKKEKEEARVNALKEREERRKRRMEQEKQQQEEQLKEQELLLQQQADRENRAMRRLSGIIPNEQLESISASSYSSISAPIQHLNLSDSSSAREMDNSNQQMDVDQ